MCDINCCLSVIFEFYFEYMDESYRSDLKHNKAVGASGSNRRVLAFCCDFAPPGMYEPCSWEYIVRFNWCKIFFHQQHNITSLVSAYICISDISESDHQEP